MLLFSNQDAQLFNQRYLNHYPPNDTIWWFHLLLLLQPFFGNLLLFLEKRTKSIRFCTKCYAKVALFCGLTVLVCCCAANQYSETGAFLKIFQKTVRILRVKQTKPPSRNAFPVVLFALESQKGFRNDEGALFWDSSWSLDLSLDPYPPNDATWWFHGLLLFQAFFSNFRLFLEEKIKSIRFCTELYAKAAMFLRHSF